MMPLQDMHGNDVQVGDYIVIDRSSIPFFNIQFAPPVAIPILVVVRDIDYINRRFVFDCVSSIDGLTVKKCATNMSDVIYKKLSNEEVTAELLKL